MGVTETTPSIVRIFCARPSKPGIPVRSYALTVMWPFTPRMRVSKSARSPFMTAITMIRVATPSAMPISENQPMTEM